MFFAQRDSLSLIRWSPHRNILGTVGASGHFSVYDPAQTARLYWREKQAETRFSNLLCLCWSPARASHQTELVAFGGQAGIVEVWDVRSGQRVCTYTGHSPEVAELPTSLPPNRRPISALAWSDDGSLLASAGNDMRVHIWRPESGELCAVADGEPFRAGCLLAWLDHRTLISSSGNHVYIWDARTGRVLQEIQTPLAWEKSNAYALAPNRQRLAVAVGSSVLLYNLRTGEQDGQYSPMDLFYDDPYYRGSPSLVAWNPDGHRLAACFASRPKRIVFWSMRGKKTLQVYQHFADITCLDWSADGSMLAWGGEGYVTTAAFAQPLVLPSHALPDHASSTIETSPAPF